MSIVEIAKSSRPCKVYADSNDLVSEIWFKTDPVDKTFISRAIQLQLQTDSCDKGQSDLDTASTGWSGFELVIFSDLHATEPRSKDGKPLVWRSHGNRLDPLDEANSVSRHYGMVFNRRQDLLDALELGNVIGVRVCAKYAGWVNDARSGRLVAKVLHEDIFSPMSWTLYSQGTPDDIPISIENGVYSLIPTTTCHLASTTDEQVDVIWFTTPVLDKNIIPRIEDIQLFTHAHHEILPAYDTKGIWCWFDLVVLENASSTVPRVKDGRALVWRSHNIPRDATGEEEQIGSLLGRDDDLLGLVEPGNVIAVRACARFPGWELDAHTARLVVRISNKGAHRTVAEKKVDWKAVEHSNQKLRETLAKYLDNVTPVGVAPALSVETTLLAQELRTDRAYGVDGGGVRGISALHTIKALMGKLTGDPNAKPCEYFDMMAGTSTGGIIALMLGRLRMTVDQCIDVYNELSSKIFVGGIMSQAGSVSTTGALYSSQVLEDAIKGIVKEQTGDPDAPMLDPDQDACKVFVLSCRADNLSNSVATHLRTYINHNVEKSFDHYKIWEAARATSAAPTYFPRMKLDDYDALRLITGVDTDVRSTRLMGEARLHFGFARPFGCLVTIGAGMEPNVELPPEGTNVFNSVTSAAGVVKGMWELNTKGEHANQKAKNLCEPGVYYRFNVGEKIAQKRWVEKVEPSLFQRWFGGAQAAIEVQRVSAENWAKITIDLADYEHMDDFARITLRYLETEEKRVEECAKKLPPKRSLIQV
ncbi:hypothetical protein CVT24_013111 [Panaeolus cyanescens]|uniref:PNPLA domain-containing protein n=1 Tax=Panaeolus cyanescens TaxID=181874 RepID=A0A409YNB6_9AGAR|nr:hypothetical protein CVT24_013111 [Panaeolus cyanescens]